MTAPRFSSGKEAMGFLTGRTPAPKKSSAQLDREIGAALSQSKKTRSSKSPKSVTTTMSASEYLASLPPAFDLQGDDRTTQDQIIARIRAELNGAIAAGALPHGTKFSVRKLHYKSYRVEITAWPGAVFSTDYTEHLLDPKGTPWSPLRSRGHDESHLAPELNEALALVNQIAERHNYTSRSDPYADYADVGYYMSVSASPVENAARQGMDLESNPKFLELMEKGRAAAKALGPAATKSICGNKDLATAGEHCLKVLIRVAERAEGRPVKYDKQRRGWFPVETTSHLSRKTRTASRTTR